VSDTRIPTTAGAKLLTLEREGKPALKVRPATRSQMARIHEAAPIRIAAGADDKVTATVGEQLRFQGKLVRWGIVEWGTDANPERDPVLGDIAPESVYDDLTDDEVARVAEYVQTGTLTEAQSGN
jgi:hypothetical protein